MAIPEPIPGLVISYAYLWADEANRGLEESAKDRPCAIVLARRIAQEKIVVTVVPITHTPPSEEAACLELPTALKLHLGLDELPSWIVLSEVNHFVWPGPDIRPIHGTNPPQFSFGVLPPGFFRRLKDGLMEAITAGRVAQVKRTQ